MNEEKAPAPQLTEDEILSTYLPTGEPIVIDLPVRGQIVFAPIGGAKGQKKLTKKIEDFVAAMPEPESPKFAVFPLRDLLPMDLDDLMFAAEIHFRALNPPISQRGAMAMHDNPDLIAYLKKKLGRADKEMIALYYQAREEEAAKKSQTPGSDDASGSAEDNSPVENPTT